ncbi:MAG: hypothetical protein ACRCR9_05935 [Chitinophagaceae bacterium]
MYQKNLPVVLLFLVSMLMACVKYEKYPYLEFKKEANYISTSETIAPNQPFKVGVIATKNNVLLKNFVVTVLYDNDSLRRTIYSNILTGDSVNRYIGEYIFTTQKKVGVERYTFSVESINGIITSQTLTINVNDL